MAAIPVTIPDHELLKCIGKGSYGEVWLGRSRTGAYRAIKIVFRDRFQSSNPFEREIEGIRQVEPVSRTHEGIVDILHVGDADGCFYYVMEAADDVVRGRDIDPVDYTPFTLAARMAAQRRMPCSECVEVGLALTRALTHLHSHDLVHRDIKPSNIIFVDGAPKLADIGLVARIPDARSYVGTEGFIPPEGPGTEQADIYSLGKVLYEAATGKDRHNFPELPTKLDDTVAESDFQELNEIIVRACHPDTNRRYRSAGEMHNDLALLQAGQSIKRLRSLERRFALLKRAASIAVPLIVLAAAVLYHLDQKQRFESAIRERERGTLIANGVRDMELGDYLGSLPEFVNALRFDDRESSSSTQSRLRIASVLSHTPTLTRLEVVPGEVTVVGFTHEGNNIIALRRFATVHTFDLTSTNTHEFNPKLASFVACSPVGNRIATAQYESVASVFDEHGNELALLKHPARVQSVNFSSDGKRLVTACDDQIGRVWDWASAQVLLELKGHTSGVTYAEFSRDGKFAITGSIDETAQIWNAQTGEPVGPRLHHKRWGDLRLLQSGWITSCHIQP